MAQFSKPPIVNPSAQPKAEPNSKIAQPVPFERLPEERKEDYNDLVEELKKEQPNKESVAYPTEPVLENVEPEVSEEDKQNFIRCLLGGKKFSKTYTLFNSVTVTMSDRSVEDTEAMYSQLSAAIGSKAIEFTTDEQWFVWLDRYLMAVNVTDIKGIEVPTKSEDLFTNVKAFMALPRPVYQAILDASKQFETLILQLVEKAQDQRFWQAGGAN